jgi:hypothetical protein
MKCPLPGVATANLDTFYHVRLTGPRAQAEATLEWVHGQEGHVVRSGPYTDSEMHPMVDVDRFLIVAHIPVSDPNG